MLHDLLVEAAGKFGDRDFIVNDEGKITFQELDKKAKTICAHLKKSGVRHGDKVIVLWDNGPEYVALFFGILMAGGVVVPLNPANYESQVKRIAGHCSARFLAATERTLPLVNSWWQGPPILSNLDSPGTMAMEHLFNRGSGAGQNIGNGSPQDLAMILYTSGTTGKPKGVMLSHKNLEANTRSILSYLPLSMSNRTLAILPFCYSYGNSLLLTHVSVGAALVIENKFAFVNKTMKTMEQYCVTGVSGVPSHFAIMINRSNFLSMHWPHLRYMTCAGGGLPPDHIRRIRTHLPHIKLYVMYGQTEGAARLSALDPDLVDVKTGSIGKGIPGVDLRVIDASGGDIVPGDIGTVIARGENIMQGYYGDSEGTREVLKNGWLNTGDLATVDEEGYIYIKGRSVEFIKCGGYRIGPQQVEEVVLEHPSVHECAVVGLPDELLGESLVAAVVFRGEANHGNDLESLTSYLYGKLPSYMVPQNIIKVESLPKTETGKLMRIKLKEDITTWMSTNSLLK